MDILYTASRAFVTFNQRASQMSVIIIIVSYNFITQLSSVLILVTNHKYKSEHVSLHLQVLQSNTVWQSSHHQPTRMLFYFHAILFSNSSCTCITSYFK